MRMRELVLAIEQTPSNNCPSAISRSRLPRSLHRSPARLHPSSAFHPPTPPPRPPSCSLRPVTSDSNRTSIAHTRTVHTRHPTLPQQVCVPRRRERELECNDHQRVR